MTVSTTRAGIGVDSGATHEAHSLEGLRSTMTYVITEPCIGVKDASCVDVCPVDCIHATDDDPQFYIDPDECIDCGACEPECPVTAIFAEDAVPDDQQQYIQINADYFKP
jgi:NAD-dependent dihydropyrimidine dehydrogenase PreA subunit